MYNGNVYRYIVACSLGKKMSFLTDTNICKIQRLFKKEHLFQFSTFPPLFLIHFLNVTVPFKSSYFAVAKLNNF